MIDDMLMKQRFAPELTPAPWVLGQHLAPWALVRDGVDDGDFEAPRLVPASRVQVSAVSPALHYGLSCFEGLKGYRGTAGLHVFRGRDHGARLFRSATRLMMDSPAPETIAEDCAAVLAANEAFVPPYGEGALYLRPLLCASEPYLGVRPSTRHRLVILASPVSRVESEPIEVWVESEVTRPARGGLGACKTGANYAATLRASVRARTRGFGHILLLDAATRTQLREGMTSNIFVVLRDAIVTPELDDTILAGITRDTCLQLLRGAKRKVIERPILLQDLEAWAASGELKEAFLVGTAAVVTPIRRIVGAELEIEVPVGDVAAWLRDAYEGVTWRDPGPSSWRSEALTSLQPELPAAELGRWLDDWLASWSGGDAAKLIEFYADDAVYCDPACPQGLCGKAALTSYFSKLLAAYPDWSWQRIAHQVDDEGRRVFLKWQASVPTDSGEVTLQGMDELELAGGRIQSNEVYFDASQLPSPRTRARA